MVLIFCRFQHICISNSGSWYIVSFTIYFFTKFMSIDTATSTMNLVRPNLFQIIWSGLLWRTHCLVIIDLSYITVTLPHDVNSCDLWRIHESSTLCPKYFSTSQCRYVQIRSCLLRYIFLKIVLHPDTIWYNFLISFFTETSDLRWTIAKNTCPLISFRQDLCLCCTQATLGFIPEVCVMQPVNWTWLIKLLYLLFLLTELHIH